MTIEWKFPHNGFGQVRGVSDAGIETFTGTEIQSLAREICQNSLDAAVEGSNATIKVDFEQYRIPSSDIPGYEQYASKIQKAYDYWSKKNSEKTIKVLTKALNAIKKPNTVVLRISDFNTTGLSHPYEDSDEGWNALTKLDGGATKTGDKAGAFGIGKNAPFTNSDYRLVFYRTLNEDQETAAQGMSRFISFPEDLSNSMNTMTTGIGYYGNPEGNLPVDSISELEGSDFSEASSCIWKAKISRPKNSSSRYTNRLQKIWQAKRSLSVPWISEQTSRWITLDLTKKRTRHWDTGQSVSA